jgi:hypothetical protein
MENVDLFYGHFEYLMVIWCILWPFGNVVVVWYIFPQFWYTVSRKIWQPCYHAAILAMPALFCN